PPPGALRRQSAHVDAVALAGPHGQRAARRHPSAGGRGPGRDRRGGAGLMDSSVGPALLDQALAARSMGDFDRAIEAWRALLRRDPDDWRLAVELKRDLKAALHYPDSDPQFRRAAR